MPEYSWWSGGQVEYLDTSDGRIAYRFWPESRSAKKTLLGIHGLGGNSDNYVALGEALKPEVAVYAIDLAGNGESGTRGDVESRHVHMRNLDTLASFIQARHPDAAHFVAGYSLGAAYAPAWAAHNGQAPDRANRGQAISGMILFAPPFRTVFHIPRVLDLALRALSSVMPRVRVPTGIRAEDALDPRYEFEMESDKFIRARTLRSLKVSADMVPLGERALPDITIPTLIVHGDADGVAFPEGAALAYERLGAADRTLVWIPGAKHDLHDVLSGVRCSEVSDDQRAPVIAAVRAWLDWH
jgi:alpha-beta hydrolase superfamily lysophospholipase